MNDRYLFKAIDINSVWRTGLLIALKGNRCAIEESDGSKWACDAKTLCQCTGLKDKNGKLIWENDIVKELFGRGCAPIKYGSYQSCFDSTKVEHIGFYVDWFGRYAKSRRKDLGYWINMVDAEVIGNRFDNPELLESEEQ